MSIFGRLKDRMVWLPFAIATRIDEPFYTPMRRLANAYLLWRNPERVREMGTKNPDKTFYVIKEFSSTIGLAGWYDRVLGYVEHADHLGYCPVIDSTSTELHSGAPDGPDCGNWGLYFKSPCKVPLKDVYSSRRVVFATQMAVIYKRFSRSEIARRHELAKRVPFSEAVQSFIDERIGALFLNRPERMVGVYYRGTDYRKVPGWTPSGHATVPGIGDFCRVVREDLVRWGFGEDEDGTHVFFMTEEQEALDSFLGEFPRARYVKKERFSHFAFGVNLPLQKLEHTSTYENNRLYLLDIVALSKCDYIIGIPNGGILMALNLNGNACRDVHLLDTGRT